MFNLKIDKKEYEILIDMCSLSLMVAHNAGAEGEHYRKMIALFNTFLEMAHDRSTVISEDRLDLVQDKYLFPACMTFFKNMTENDVIATEIIADNPDIVIAQVIR